MIQWLTAALIAVLFAENVTGGGPGSCQIYTIKGLECRTGWFNSDNSSGEGDFETIAALHEKYPGQICTKPLAMEAQTTNGVSAAATGDVIAMNDKETGFACKNEDQTDGKECQDYRIRFMCPLVFCDQPQCWTGWKDRDKPSGSGDWESKSSLLREYPLDICAHPIGIEVRTSSLLTVKSTEDVIFRMDTNYGFACKNEEQVNKTCENYEVRFECGLDFCIQQQCWSDWMDGGSYSPSEYWGVFLALRSEKSDAMCKNSLAELKKTDGADYFDDYEIRHLCKSDAYPQ